MKTDWMNFTTAMVAKQIGPASMMIIDQSLQQLNSRQKKMRSTRDYLVFLKILKKELPDGIDKKTLCEDLWVEMMDKKNIF